MYRMRMVRIESLSLLPKSSEALFFPIFLIFFCYFTYQTGFLTLNSKDYKFCWIEEKYNIMHDYKISEKKVQRNKNTLQNLIFELWIICIFLPGILYTVHWYSFYEPIQEVINAVVWYWKTKGKWRKKGQCHEIFCFWFFSWISFPPAPEYSIRTVSNFRKIWNVPNGIIRGLGETDPCRKPEVKNLVALSL